MDATSAEAAKADLKAALDQLNQAVAALDALGFEIEFHHRSSPTLGALVVSADARVWARIRKRPRPEQWEYFGSLPESGGDHEGSTLLR